MERGESTPTPLLCAEGSNPQRRAHAAQRLLARSRLASGQLKTQPEQFLSICTHGPLLLRVQFEVRARTILFLGTMPWARSVWSRRFDVLKKKKTNNKNQASWLQSHAFSPLIGVITEKSCDLTWSSTARRLRNSLLCQWTPCNKSREGGKQPRSKMPAESVRSAWVTGIPEKTRVCS